MWRAECTGVQCEVPHVSQDASSGVSSVLGCNVRCPMCHRMHRVACRVHWGAMCIVQCVTLCRVPMHRHTILTDVCAL